MIQVVVNLLSNAIKYTPEGGRILLGAEREGHDVVFFVADNGYGIPPSVHGKVFERFFQADSIMSQKVGGSGLGLSIAKGIVLEHGGTVHFESPFKPTGFRTCPSAVTAKELFFGCICPAGNGVIRPDDP